MDDQTDRLKRALRNRVRQLATEHDAAWRNEVSERIMARCQTLDAFVAARRVALYWSLPEEVQTHDAVCRWAGMKEVFLPVMKGEELELRRFTERGALHKARFGVWEPTAGERVDSASIDLLVVPAVSFDRRGNRLGHGKGFYDRLLEGFTGTTVGVCFDYQLSDCVPVAPYDRPVDMLLCGDLREVRLFGLEPRSTEMEGRTT